MNLQENKCPQPKNKCVVFSFKYNDAFYAVNTNEFKECSEKILVIFESSNLKSCNFPFQELFDEIIIIPYAPQMRKILQAILKVKTLLLKEHSVIDYLFTSNIRLFVSQYIIQKTNCDVVLVEDGTMNYKKAIFVGNSFSKNILLKIFGIQQGNAQKRVVTSYLTVPEKAVYYFGVLKKLLFEQKPLNADNVIAKLNGKRIFIGGTYYLYNHISITNYNRIVNKICSNYKIDFYVPHHYASSDEIITIQEFNLNAYGLTFEMIFPFFEDLEIYSLGSSVMFSVKTLNKSIKNYLVNSSCYSKELRQGNKFIRDYCDEIIDCE